MKLNKTILLVTLLITGLSQAKTAGKFYMLIDDGKGFVDACELKLALPTKIEKLEKYKFATGYAGSTKTGTNSYEHYFKTEKDCKVAVVFQNSDR